MNEKVIKNSKWLLIFGAAVVIYTLIGGLITPLKTGVSGTNKFKINSLELDSASFEIYNPVQELNIQEVYLSKEGKLWKSESVNISNNWVNARFKVQLGNQQ